SSQLQSQCLGTVTSHGGNVSSDATCGFTQATDRQSVDPGLGSLLPNGGPTDTHALLVGSPAIDRVPAGGAVSLCLSVDQRGRPPPAAAGGGPNCDSGAFGAQKNPCVPRPPVGVRVEREAGGRVLVTVGVTTNEGTSINTMHQIRFG